MLLNHVTVLAPLSVKCESNGNPLDHNHDNNSRTFAELLSPPSPPHPPHCYCQMLHAHTPPLTTKLLAAFMDQGQKADRF